MSNSKDIISMSDNDFRKHLREQFSDATLVDLRSKVDKSMCPDCGMGLDLEHNGCRGVVRDESNGGWRRK